MVGEGSMGGYMTDESVCRSWKAEQV